MFPLSQRSGVHLEVLVLGHDGDLVAVHAEDFALQVDQLSLAHFHVVAGLQVVFTLLACTKKTNKNPLFELVGNSER